MSDISLYIYSLLALPLLGLLLFPLIGKSKQVYLYSSTILSTVSLVASSILFYLVYSSASGAVELLKWEWLSVGSFSISMGLMVDFLGASMALVVATVACMVQWFSISYMAHDPARSRYFAFLNFFVLAMLSLVFSSNLLQTFIFWELVGFASWLLIGFWHQKPAAALAAKKAFIVNRIGDFGFVVALMVVLAIIGTFNYFEIIENIGNTRVFSGAWLLPVQEGPYPKFQIVDASILHLAGIGLLLAVMGKSAQFPLAVWLPDAMEGPTPVSALIHAATMVAAGVFLVVRYFFLFTPEVLDVMAVIGAITAFMGAYAAFSQFDIKKILAYSTISQLGYMVLALGVGAWSAGYFHLVTHAFFKAGLFLGAGVIIHFVAHHTDKADKLDPQDIRNMGGLRKALPVFHIFFLLCTLSLMGVPGFSGFLSKEAILTGVMTRAGEGSWTWMIIALLAFLTVLMTVLYMARLYSYVFLGREYQWINKHSLSLKLLMPVVILGILSVGLWFSFGIDFNESWFIRRLGEPLLLMSNLPGNLTVKEFATIGKSYHTFITILSIGLVLIALIASARIFRIPRHEMAYESNHWLAKLSANNWYVNMLNHYLIVWPVLKASQFATWFDTKVIDKMVDLLGIFVVVFSNIGYWFDRTFVDGAINFMARLSAGIGGVAGSSKDASVQGYVIVAIALFLIFLVGLVFVL
ncbi:NADH-quinone oxidoreductase subunit 5 family protein [Peijinzhouia sedimentorum]